MALIRRLRAAFGDPVLAAVVAALSLFGVAMIYSAGQLDVPDPRAAGAWKMQLVWLALSAGALLRFLPRRPS